MYICVVVIMYQVVFLYNCKIETSQNPVTPPPMFRHYNFIQTINQKYSIIHRFEHFVHILFKICFIFLLSNYKNVLIALVEYKNKHFFL